VDTPATYPETDAPEMVGPLADLRSRIAFPQPDLAEIDAACEHWVTLRRTRRMAEAEDILGCGNSPTPTLISPSRP